MLEFVKEVSAGFTRENTRAGRVIFHFQTHFPAFVDVQCENMLQLMLCDSPPSSRGGGRKRKDTRRDSRLDERHQKQVCGLKNSFKFSMRVFNFRW